MYLHKKQKEAQLEPSENVRDKCSFYYAISTFIRNCSKMWNISSPESAVLLGVLYCFCMGKKSLRIPFILKGLILTFLRTVLPVVINSPSSSHWKKCIEHKVKEHNVMAISPGLQDFKHCFTALPSMPKNEVYCAPFIMVFCKNYNG